MSERVMTPWTVVRDGGRLIWRFVKMHPLPFSIAVFGAAIFAGSIISSPLVFRWLTANVILPMLDQRQDPPLLPIPPPPTLCVPVFKSV